jgi:hypothetical protein
MSEIERIDTMVESLAPIYREEVRGKNLANYSFRGHINPKIIMCNLCLERNKRILSDEALLAIQLLSIDGSFSLLVIGPLSQN